MSKKLSTTKSKAEVTDSDLHCYFCRKNDRQSDMTFTTGISPSGQKLRRAYHKRCQRLYRQKLRERNKNFTFPVTCKIEFEDGTKPVIFKPKDTLFQKLIDSVEP